MHNEPIVQQTNRFRWNHEAQAFQSAPSTEARKKSFIKGPLPLIWFEKAAILPGKALHVALAIWYRVGLERQSTVKLGQKVMSRFGVSRDAKYDALRRLVEAGLIEIEQLPGKAPIVTVISLDTISPQLEGTPAI